MDKEKDSKNFDKSVSTSSSSTAPQETTLPNLWGSTPAPSSNPFQRATTTPSNYANLFGASGANPNPSMGSEMELVRQLVSTNPEMVSSVLCLEILLFVVIEDDSRISEHCEDESGSG